jgi:hypothetical protein
MMVNKIYPDHIYDKARVEIMASLITKECIKLFPSLNQKYIGLIGVDIKNWFDGSASDLSPVHDFWNLTDGIMVGSKLKQIVKSLTAQNYTWRRDVDIPLKDIKISWPIGVLSEMGPPPYSYDDVINALNSSDKMEESIKDSDRLEAQYVPRDHYPVILRESSMGNYYEVLDGNRRTFRAILKGHTNIKADVGRRNHISDKAYPINYWVTTGELRKMMTHVEICSAQNQIEILDSIKTYLKYLFSLSDIAKINWDLRCKNNSEVVQKFSLDLYS